MSDYNPSAIRKMAGVLTAVATLTRILFGIAGATTALAIIVVGGSAGSTLGLAAFVGGVVYGALVFGVGYLISLVIGAFAQLMLAVVQIEVNTSRAASIQAGAGESDAVPRVTPVEPAPPNETEQSESVHRRAVPRRIQELYAQAREKYEELIKLDGDAFFETESAAALRSEIPALFREIATECERQDPRVAAAVARKAREDFPELLSDPDFSEELDALAG